ncbi:alkylated DNA repair protein ALKBH8 homolog isoform X2 [Elaeis guineensis]|uniref:Alkylated DNA repair protein ALKBH8 homolog isoform X2 n=1 Tax=Elaeis guineensis var. tenera TaxID=51953 RepID=A0A6I9S422_ELAGV|nr:alkylated DNA repair protein ALKBH8 homolog isoform X2 [Elaeis guineensis]
MNKVQSKFTRPKGMDHESSSNLYVANCGPAVGISFDNIESVFSTFGKVIGVHAADETGTRVIVCFHEILGGDSLPVCLSASELAIPGIYLVHEFITLKEEKELLAEVDARPWKRLSKRKVQHYGYEFLYETRNVDSKQFLGELPSFVSHILKKIMSFPGLDDDRSKQVDQLTVNEYPSGVGLSPHIDTHSAFDELIFSLSLAGPCIMEFRRYPQGTFTAIGNNPQQLSNFTRKAIFLPPRSMLLISGEGRYAWHHYIPHHKVDTVGGHVVRRSSRRVSFTFRKVRKGPCCCEYKQYCDSQKNAIRAMFATENTKQRRAGHIITCNT